MPVRFPVFTSKVNYRNHRKICVIDGEVGFIGGMNIANRYVKIIRDYAIVGNPVETRADCEAVFKKFGVDVYGLDILDKKLLQHLYSDGNPRVMGLTTLASLIGEEVSTIEDIVEPYLLQIGFIERTPRGRQITAKGIEYLKNQNI